MNARWVILPLALMEIAWTSVAGADGYLPSQPYHYLHPPRALARTNRAPRSLRRSFPLKRGRLATSFVSFTPDSQAGLGADAGVLASAGRAVLLTIIPVNTPGRFPAHYLLDGNAYRITLVGTPGNHRVAIRKHLSLALRWPHFPAAVLRYDGRHWRRICSAGNWQLSASAVLVCSVTAVGTFAIVRFAVH